MKITRMYCAVAMLALAGCASSPTVINPNGTTGKYATDVGNKPNGQLDNAGGGLSQNMTPREADMAFRTMDTNNDGYVDKSEFMHYGDSGQRFNGCDTDGDGKLTPQEYIACSQRPASVGG